MKEKIDAEIKKGNIYFIGHRLPDDWYEAFNNWEGLASSVDVTSDDKSKVYYNLAYCYLHGEGVKKNIEKAGELYDLAGGMGLSDAFVKAYKIKLLTLKIKTPTQALALLNEVKSKLTEVTDTSKWIDREYDYVNVLNIVDLLSKASFENRYDLARKYYSDGEHWLEGFLATEGMDVEVDVTTYRTSRLHNSGVIEKGNTKFVSEKVKKTKYSIVINNNSDLMITSLGVCLSVKSLGDVMSAMKTDNVVGRMNALKESRTVIVMPNKSNTLLFAEDYIWKEPSKPYFSTDLLDLANVFFAPSEFKCRVNSNLQLKPKMKYRKKIGLDKIQKGNIIRLVTIVLILYVLYTL